MAADEWWAESATAAVNIRTAHQAVTIRGMLALTGVSDIGFVLGMGR